MERIKRGWHIYLAISACVVWALVANGCVKQEFRTNAYKTLAAGAAIYESGYPAFLEFHQRGLVTDAQKAAGKAIAIKYWGAYHVASDALIAYDAVDSAENKDRVRVALDEAVRCLSTLSAYVQPFLSKGVK